MGWKAFNLISFLSPHQLYHKLLHQVQYLNLALISPGLILFYSNSDFFIKFTIHLFCYFIIIYSIIFLALFEFLFFLIFNHSIRSIIVTLIRSLSFLSYSLLSDVPLFSTVA